MAQTGSPSDEFVRNSVWHGDLVRARAILAEHPEVASSSIQTAALLGDQAGVGKFLAADPALAVAKLDPLGWDALTHLCFSRFLRLESTRTDGFLEAARALLNAGANANTGFFENNHQPAPEWESALYGAAGVAHHAGLTRLLLEHGADPNDEEVPYHAPETYDNAALHALVESGKLNADSMATLLLRKADWHDLNGIRYLLDHGADPNRVTRWRHTALHQALRRDNVLEIIEVMLGRGANPLLPNGQDGANAVLIALRRGRGDVLDVLDQSDTPIPTTGLQGLLAACARNDSVLARSIISAQPDAAKWLISQGGARLGEFAGNGNTDGVALLIDLGVPVDALYSQGDGYYEIATNSTALHIAAWRGRHDTVALLIERRANVNAPDGQGRTPLMLAVKACVNSHWKQRRKPDSVKALLQAGALRDGVSVPTGYDAIDEILRARP